MASISLRNVVKVHGRGRQALQVIHGVDAEIADREFVVIVVQNDPASGKRMEA